jgi:hypothetical protein
MADHYVWSSSKMKLTPEQIVKAEAIVARVVKELEDDADEGYCGVDVVVEKDGVWFAHNESINPEHVVLLAQALLDDLEIDLPFIFSWAFVCTKPRLDEFGGGACAVRRGKDPFYVDARNYVEEVIHAEERAKC